MKNPELYKGLIIRVGVFSMYFNNLSDARKRDFFDRTNCILCGACTSSLCGSLKIAGYVVSTDEIITEVIKDKQF